MFAIWILDFLRLFVYLYLWCRLEREIFSFQIGEIFEDQQEIATRTVIWARQLVSPQPKQIGTHRHKKEKPGSPVQSEPGFLERDF